MKRIVLAGLFSLVAAAASQAQGVIPPAGYGGGAGSWGPGTAWASDGLGFINKRPGFFGTAPYGFMGFGLRMYPGIHQHGPLVNYGPYTGYYPFEPYGPWTENLQYTGPMTAPFADRWNSAWTPTYGRLGLVGNGPVAGLGRYALQTLRNVGQRINPFGHRRGHGSGSLEGGCSTCGTLSHSGQAGSGNSAGYAALPLPPIQTASLVVNER
jgi:hypothetical protein